MTRKIQVEQGFASGWGKRLARARKKLGLTQSDLGDSLGVRNTAVSKWEQEATDSIDERSLTSMEFLHGIRREWIISGEEPMTESTWNREVLRGTLDKLASARVDGVWAIPPKAGMSPVFGAGELVFWSETDEPTQGAFLIVAPTGAVVTTPGLPPDGAQIGQAFRAGTNGEWLLYRPEDREHPGTFPPITLAGMRVIGRVVARASAVDPIEQALRA